MISGQSDGKMNIPLHKRFARYNTLITGIISGIILPVLVYFILYFTAVRDIRLTLFSDRQIIGNIIPIIMSHCILPNLLIFLAFLGFNWSQAAKGVLAVTVVMTVILFALKVILASI